MKVLLALFCGFFVNLIKKSLTTRFGGEKPIFVAYFNGIPISVMVKQIIEGIDTAAEYLSAEFGASL